MDNVDEIWGDRKVKEVTNLSRTTRWRMENKGTFPRRRQLSPNRVGWLRSEILVWVEERDAVRTPEPSDQSYATA